MESGQVYLSLYVLAWALTFIIYIKRKKTFDAGACLILAYLVYSFFSYLTFNTPGHGGFRELKFFPFVYLFASVIIVMYPVLSINISKESIIKQPDLKLFKSFCVFIILVSLIQLPDIIVAFRDGLMITLTTYRGGADLYAESIDSVADTGHGVSNFFAILSSAFGGISILLFFYSLTISGISKILRYLLLVPCFLGVLNGIALGQRGAMIQPLLVMIVTYFVFYKRMPKSTNKIIRRFGGLIIALVCIPFMALTFSRFDTQSYDVESSFIHYAGQSSLHFNNYGLDDGGIRYGDRTIPLFKRMVGIDNVPRNFVERRNKYQNLKINDEVFCTFVGDLAIDFGPIVGFLIILISSFYLKNRTRPQNGIICFHNLILLHFIMYLCIIGGLKLFPFSDTSGNLKLIVYFLSYYFFKNFTFSHGLNK